MTKLVWDDVGERQYEIGCDRGVLYLPGVDGVPWNGLTSVAESPNGGDETPYYLDGIKYLSTMGNEDYSATIEAFTYPDAFEQCVGSQEVEVGVFATAQPKVPFSLSYRTKIVNDTDGADYAYKIHLISNAVVATPDKTYKTQGADTSLDALSWTITSTPELVPGHRPTSHMIIDTRYMDADTLATLEAILYGDDELDAAFITTVDLIALISTGGSITVADNGNGTWTALGPNNYVRMIDANRYQIDEANVIWLTDHKFILASTDEDIVTDDDVDGADTEP